MSLATQKRDLALAQGVGKVASFAAMVIVARRLGPAAFGNLMASFTMVYLLSLFVEFGFSQYLTRETARNPPLLGPMLSSVNRLKAIHYLVGVGLLVGTLPFLAWRTDFVAPLALVAAGEVMFLTAMAAASGCQRFRLVAGMSLSYDLIRAGLVTGAALAMPAPEPVGWAYAGAAAAAGLVGTLSLRGLGLEPAPRESWPPVRAIYRGSVGLFVYTLVHQLYFRIDMLMLRALGGAEETGIYAAAYRAFEVSFFLPALLMGVLFPRVAASSGPAETAAEMRSAQAEACIIGGGIVVLSWGAARPAMELLLGPTFSAATVVLLVLLAALAIIYVNAIYPTVLNASGKELRTAIALAIGAVTNVALNLWLIPAYGAVGAASATLVTEVVVTALYLVMTRQLLRGEQLMGSQLPRIAAAFVFAGTTVFLAARVDPWLAIVVGAVTYPAAIAAVRGGDLKAAMDLFLFRRP